jgi:hypothetical protein
MNETPRTDELALGPIASLPSSERWAEAIGLSRTLERELADVTAERDRMREALQRVVRAFEADAEQVPTMDVLTSWETNGQAIAQARAALAKVTL